MKKVGREGIEEASKKERISIACLALVKGGTNEGREGKAKIDRSLQQTIIGEERELRGRGRERERLNRFTPLSFERTGGEKDLFFILTTTN